MDMVTLGYQVTRGHFRSRPGRQCFVKGLLLLFNSEMSNELEYVLSDLSG